MDTTLGDTALGHDSFTQYGGAERVMEALHELYPDAPVYTTVIDAKKFPGNIKGWRIIPSSWLQVIYNLYPKFQHLLPFIPFAVNSLRVQSGIYVLLTSSSSFIKGLYKPAGSVHINYCHTPTRFIWSESEYVKQETPFLLLPFARVFLSWMKQWDFRASQRVDHFIANSVEVQKRIKQFYNRDSVVIYPFIDVNFWKPTRAKSNYFLIAGRLNAHKSNDLVIQAVNELGLELHVVGTGRQEQYLKSIAGPTVKLLGRVNDEALRDEYSGAQGFIYPQFEDIGLMPLEAAACGTATLALGRGGSLETVVPGVTGEFFEREDKELIKAALQNWDYSKYSPENMIIHARKFSKEIFKEKVKSFIDENRD